MKSIESLDAWKVAQNLAESTYRLTLRPPLNRHFALANQVRRSAISIPSNVAEGYGLGTRAQFVRHLRIALGSAAELDSHLRLAASLKLISQQDVTGVRKDLDGTTGLLIGLLKSLGSHVHKSNQ